MALNGSRGNDISGYTPAMGSRSQLVVRSTNISAKAVTSAYVRAAYLSGTIVSGQTVRAIAHGLAVKPKFVVVAPLLSLAQSISARVPAVTLSSASAATSTNFYVVTSAAANAALKYVAYVQL